MLTSKVFAFGSNAAKLREISNKRFQAQRAAERLRYVDRTAEHRAAKARALAAIEDARRNRLLVRAPEHFHTAAVEALVQA